MEVTRLHCPACDTTIEGRFAMCKFCQLSEEMQDFVAIFIRSRGNIKEVERVLGISYPTVRGRLDAVIRALGYTVDGPVEPEEPVRPDRRREVLDALGRGEITAQEAASRLRRGD
jgi:hypothetical protein